MKDVEAQIARAFFSKTYGSRLIAFTPAEPTIKREETEEYLRRAAEYAKEHNAYVVPPLYVEGGKLALCMINPDGKVVGKQYGVFLHPQYSSLTPGDSIELIETPFGIVLLCVDSDVYHPEYMRMAALAGAEIAVCTQYFSRGGFSRQAIQNGPFNAAQANCIYVLSSTNVECSIIAPSGETRYRSGYLVHTARPPMNSTLSAAHRQNVYFNSPLFDQINRDFVRNNYDYL